MPSPRIRPRILYKDAINFCKAHLGKDAFAPFTGQDWSAWIAFVYLVEMYSRSDTNGQEAALEAMHEMLKGCQNSEIIHQLFVQAIPAVMDWSHAAEIWPLIMTDWLLRPIQAA